jgi:hypothetical protein
VPIEKERIGGTEEVLAKMDEAWRIVPSPPKVAMRSTLGSLLRGGAGKEKMGKRRWSRIWLARAGSKMREREG